MLTCLCFSLQTRSTSITMPVTITATTNPTATPPPIKIDRDWVGGNADVGNAVSDITFRTSETGDTECMTDCNETAETITVGEGEVNISSALDRVDIDNKASEVAG